MNPGQAVFLTSLTLGLTLGIVIYSRKTKTQTLRQLPQQYPEKGEEAK